MPTTQREGPGPLAASCYADGAVFVVAETIDNVSIARDTFRLRIAAQRIAARITPGQFLMLRVAGTDDPLLGRAFALYDVSRDTEGGALAVDVVYLAHGKMTKAMANLRAGERVEVWGPLGAGFSPEALVGACPDRLARLVLVAGGIGQTPMLALGKEALGAAAYGASVRRRFRAERVTLLYGARSAAYLAGLEDFAAAGFEVRVATDDGSAGRNGLVTDLLREALAEPSDGVDLVACCGPEPMMAAAAEICRRRGVACLVSLETPMACGVGACFSCVAPVWGEDGAWDYKRTCVEGPVFDASRIAWDEA